MPTKLIKIMPNICSKFQCPTDRMVHRKNLSTKKDSPYVLIVCPLPIIMKVSLHGKMFNFNFT